MDGRCQDDRLEAIVGRSSLVNHRNGASITAYAATAHVGRGGRYTWFVMDELGSFPAVLIIRPSNRLSTPRTLACASRRRKGQTGRTSRLCTAATTSLKLPYALERQPDEKPRVVQVREGGCGRQRPGKQPSPQLHREKPDLFSETAARNHLEKGWRPWYDKESVIGRSDATGVAQEFRLGLLRVETRLIFGRGLCGCDRGRCEFLSIAG